jgi:GxxExxY protein
MTDLLQGTLTERIIGAAMRVHKALGPGLLESVYEVCLAYELRKLEIPFRCQADLPVVYDGQQLGCGFRIDLLVDESVVVELKAIDALQPVHEAQLLTYLRLSRMQVGLLINFNVEFLKHGIIRRVL